MILTDLGSVTAYRMHTPKWATAPTSGAGAATHGGRANRPGHSRTGVSTSLPVDAAGHPRELHGERNGSGRLPARLRLGGLVVIVGGVLLRLARALVQPARRAAQLGAGRRSSGRGAKGILFGSRIAPGGINLVPYNEMLSADDALTVYDPAGALPRNQDSWR